MSSPRCRKSKWVVFDSQRLSEPELELCLPGLVQRSSSWWCPETGLPCISVPLGPACGLGVYAGALELSDPPGAVASRQPTHVGILSTAFVLPPARKACTLALVTNVSGHIEMFKMLTKIPRSKCRMSHSKTGAETQLWGQRAIVQVQCCSMWSWGKLLVFLYPQISHL